MRLWLRDLILKLLDVTPNVLTRRDVRVIQSAFIEWQNNMCDVARENCWGRDERIVAQERWPEAFQQISDVLSKLNSLHK